MSAKVLVTREQAAAALSKISQLQGEPPLDVAKFVHDNIVEIQAALARHVTIAALASTMAAEGIKISEAQLRRYIKAAQKTSTITRKVQAKRAAKAAARAAAAAPAA